MTPHQVLSPLCTDPNLVPEVGKHTTLKDGRVVLVKSVYYAGLKTYIHTDKGDFGPNYYANATDRK